jgi:hypothetical protein
MHSSDNGNPEQLQRELSTLMIDKDRMEQEFWRMGNSRSKVQI